MPEDEITPVDHTINHAQMRSLQESESKREEAWDENHAGLLAMHELAVGMLGNTRGVMSRIARLGGETRANYGALINGQRRVSIRALDRLCRALGFEYTRKLDGSIHVSIPPDPGSVCASTPLEQG